MFKYIADILSKFSVAQRLLVLILVLITITIVMIGPKLIDFYNHDDTGLNKRIELQKEEINRLNEDIIKLNDQIRADQITCTNEIVQIQRDIVNKLSNLETKRTLVPLRIVRSRSIVPDTTVRIVQESNPMNNDDLSVGLSRIKNDILNNIKGRK